MLTALLASMILAQTPGPLLAERLPFDPAQLASSAKAEIRVEEDGRVVTYKGIALATLLESKVKDPGSMPGLRSLADSVLLVRGSDGYQAAVSAVAVAMDPKGARYFLAVSQDGRAFDKGTGPVRLIVPGDPKHVRWVKDVASIRLVKLDKLGEP